MAGIWERIKETADDRLAVHLLEAAIVLHQTNAFTKAQILAGLNAELNTPLTTAEETDLNAIMDALDTSGTVTNRLVYLAKVKAWTIAAEHGSVTEAQFRTGLGI